MNWTRETLRTELIRLLERHTSDGVEVKESSHLVADLSIDSLGVMELLAEIEDRFELNIPDEVLREVNTVADVAMTIENKLHNDGRLAG
jgi:acyl carrier protein